MQIPDLTPVKDSFNPLNFEVKPQGDPAISEFALIGEAPGATEIKTGIPFSGPAGIILDRVLNAVGIPRYKCYVTNACKAKIPKNDAKLLINAKGWRHEKFVELQTQLIDELAKVAAPTIVVLGDTAMKMLFDTPRIDKISKFRGSVYKAEDFPHLRDKLAGKLLALSYHPASCLPSAQPKNFYVMISDFKKFLDLSADASALTKTFTTHINPSLDDALDFMNEVSKKEETAFDIEATPHFATCFSMSLSPTEAMSIPLINNRGNVWTPEQELQIWQALSARILDNPKLGKIMQNGMFDIMFLARTIGMRTSNFSFDTMLAQHICWTDLPKGLDFLTSIYTNFPYYKDEGKQTMFRLIKDWDQHQEYNAKDSIMTHSCREPLTKELIKFNAMDSFNHAMELHQPLMEIEYRGILTDTAGIRIERTKLGKKITALQRALDRKVGMELNTNSPKQMKQYFYVDLGIAPYVNRKSGTLTMDDMALKRIARKGKKGAAEAKIIRKMRKLTKLIGTYFEVAVDEDYRLRCGYKIAGTASGRLSSSKTFFGTGTNLQNQPRRFKKYLKADRGSFLIEPDLSQAEARVVAYACQDQNMIEGFESGVDVHTYNASKIFNKPMAEITKKERAMGKRIVHASNYDMGYVTLSLQLEIPQNEAKSLLEAYHARFPGLKRWHSDIRDTIGRTKILYNLFNRPKRFLGLIDGTLLRSAYSYIPQSTVAEQLNRGLVKVAQSEFFTKHQAQIMPTVHDSLMLQLPECYYSIDKIYSIMLELRNCMECNYLIKGRKFVIPIDAKISRLGGNWRDMAEIKTIDKSTIEKAIN